MSCTMEVSIIPSIFFIQPIAEICNYPLNYRSICEILSNILIRFSYSPQHIDDCSGVIRTNATQQAVYQLSCAILGELILSSIDYAIFRAE